MGRREDTTTVVVGLDGGCFGLINDWLKAGYLPNIRCLQENGIASPLQSQLPPVTCPNWMCYATGCNPGQLGVFWWERVNRPARSIENTSMSHQFDRPPLWEFLNGSQAIINMPTSYPPREHSGVTIAGGPSAPESGYTYPESLEPELESKGYKVHPSKISLLSKDDPDSECIPEIYEVMDQRFDVAEDLIRSGDYEFVHVTLYYLNILHHFFWNHDVVLEAWRRIDARIGTLLEMENIDHLFVMSDHGSNKIHTVFRVNTWLKRNGYLRTERGVSDVLQGLGITRESVRPILGKLGLEWWVRQILPRNIQNLLPYEGGKVDGSAKQNVIDWEDSMAVASGQGPLYVLADDPAERARIRNRLLQDLEGIRDDDGNPVVKDIHKVEDIYTGPSVKDGPDLMLVQAPHVHIDGSIGSDEVFGSPGRWIGENQDTGLFFAYGPMIDCDATLNPSMGIVDIVPTILHLQGRPIPDHVDGTVRKELFVPKSSPRKRKVEVTKVSNSTTQEMDIKEDVSVDERLKSLGYLE